MTGAGASRPHGGRPGLRAKLMRAVGALVAAVLLANAALMVFFARRGLREQIEARGRAFGQLAAEPVGEAYETYFQSGYSKFRERLLAVTELNPDLQAFRIYDTAGHLLFESAQLNDPLFQPTAGGQPARASEPELLEGLQGLEPVAYRDRDSGLYRVVAPWVEDWGRHRYTVVFDVSYASLADTTLTAGFWILLLSSLSLALGVGIAGLLARQILEPVRELTRGARDLAGGDLARKIEVRTGDELEVLATGFNEMASGLARSIAELESSNRALQEVNEELKQLDRLKNDLLANVSHELRTPLTAIQGYSEALSDGLLGTPSEEQKEVLGVLRRNVLRLKAMIEQLLSFSRLESGAGNLELVAFDLVRLAQDALENLRAGPLAGQRRLHLDAPPDLPAAYGDPARIAEVLDNLLGNAAKFTPSDGRIEVVLAERGGDGLVVEVCDDGTGIAAADREKIFERFYQADSSSRRRFGGMGLGLAIVREILTAHRSEVEVESEPGEGTTFRFTLPRALEPAASPRAGDGRAGAGGEPPKRLLVVDDDPHFVQLVSGFLRREGFDVETVTSAERGLARAREAGADLIVLDRLLPDADGFDLLAELKRDPETSAIPVLVVSIRREKALGLRLGASGYLVKPVDLPRLEELIRQTLADAEPPGEVEATGSHPLVLVVDDEHDLRDLLARRLMAGGLRVATAASGAEALELLEEETPHMMLLDLMMPGMDGWDVLREVRASPAAADLPVVVLTARDTADDQRQAAELGVVETLSKPFDLGALVAEIERTLAAGRKR